MTKFECTYKTVNALKKLVKEVVWKTRFLQHIGLSTIHWIFLLIPLFWSHILSNIHILSNVCVLVIQISIINIASHIKSEVFVWAKIFSLKKKISFKHLKVKILSWIWCLVYFSFYPTYGWTDIRLCYYEYVM